MLIYAARVRVRGEVRGARLARTYFGWRCLAVGNSRRPPTATPAIAPDEAVADFLDLPPDAWPEVLDLAPLPGGTMPRPKAPTSPRLETHLVTTADPDLAAPATRYRPARPPSPVVGRLRELMILDARPATDLARLAGMSRQQWGQIAGGLKASPSITTVDAILQALGRTFADLCDPIRPTVAPAPAPAPPAPKGKARR